MNIFSNFDYLIYDFFKYDLLIFFSLILLQHIKADIKSVENIKV
jgi:hypothetical protein